jgi:hypothetical protein
MCESCDSRFSCVGNLIKHRKSRPETCGQPQFKNNTKAAPRATSASFNKNAPIKLPAVYLPKIARGPYNTKAIQEVENNPGLRINKVELITEDIKQPPEVMIQTIDDDDENKYLNFDYLLNEEKLEGGATIFKQEKVECNDSMHEYISDSYSWHDQNTTTPSLDAHIPGLKIELIEKPDEGGSIPISDDDDAPLVKYKRPLVKKNIKKSKQATIKRKLVPNSTATVTIKKVEQGGGGGMKTRPQPPIHIKLQNLSSDSSDSDDSDFTVNDNLYRDGLERQKKRVEEAEKVLEEHFKKLEFDTYECKQCPKQYTTKPFM